MRQFKLVKSVGYATYPLYQELIKISKSVTTFRDTIFSAVIAALFNATPASNYIIKRLQSMNFGGVLGTIINYEHINLLLAILGALVLLGLISLYRFLHSIFGSSNSSKAKRDFIVDKFYHVAIPQWVEVSSILEQVHEIDSEESPSESINRKKLLLLLQAKHEIFELYSLIRNLRVKQFTPVKYRNLHGQGTQDTQDNRKNTDNSNILLDRIGECAYDELIQAIYYNLCEIHSGLKMYELKTKKDIEQIGTKFKEKGPFDTVDALQEVLGKKRVELRNTDKVR